MENNFPVTDRSLVSIKNVKKDNVLYVVERLVDLMSKNELTRNILKEESRKLNQEAHSLGILIIFKNKLVHEYVQYKTVMEIEGEVDEDEIVFSFFEKIQQKPVQLEELPQAVETPEVVVAPAVLLEEELQPIAAPLQEQMPKVSKVSIAKPVLPKKTKEVIHQLGMKNWWEVKRETEVMAVEDLSGSTDVFERHVTKLGVAEKDSSGHWKWTGKDKKVVFLGDILGDYEMNGIEITNTIFDLAKQAEKVAGKMDMLCGNHDAFFINFLCQRYSKEYCIKNADSFFTLLSGVWELAQYDSKLKEIELEKRMKIKGLDDEKIKEIKKSLVGLFYDGVPLILTNMKNSSEGRKILENICQIKVAAVHDDTLFCHTDPTTGMIADLTKDENIAQRVAEVNQIFQEDLRKALFDGIKLSDEFKYIDDIYLNTENREYFTELKSITESALVKSVEYLYENKQIKFDQETEAKFKKDGYRSLIWYTWQWRLSRKLEDANIGINKDAIEEWKRENGVAGDYTDEIEAILNKLVAIRRTKGDKEKDDEYLILDKLIVALEEKIKTLNLPGTIQKIRNSGINAIIHGHSPIKNRYYDESGLVIISPHSPFSDTLEKGVSVIKTNGKIDLSGKVFRDKRK